MDNINKLPGYVRLVVPYISMKINHSSNVENIGNLLTQPLNPYQNDMVFMFGTAFKNPFNSGYLCYVFQVKDLLFFLFPH